MQQQGELLADPMLADEVVEPLGPQRALDHPLVAVGQRRDNAVGPGLGAVVVLVVLVVLAVLPRLPTAFELGFLGPGEGVAAV